MKPTGRRRYRTQRTLFKGTLMVLQIECTQRCFDPFRMDHREFTEWRDARPEDITEFS